MLENLEMYGLGVDVVSTRRILSVLDRYGPRFLSRFLTRGELQHFSTLTGNRKKEFICGRFVVENAPEHVRWAAKEAIIKSLSPLVFSPLEIAVSTGTVFASDQVLPFPIDF
jgi:phosphopantetheine--protein transferase-like protein